MRGHGFPAGGQPGSRFAVTSSLSVTNWLAVREGAAAPLPVLGPRTALRAGSACQRINSGSCSRGLRLLAEAVAELARLQRFPWPLCVILVFMSAYREFLVTANISSGNSRAFVHDQHLCMLPVKVVGTHTKATDVAGVTSSPPS